MDISFVETMRGSLKDAQGVEHPIEFHIRSDGDTTGRCRVHGLITVPPWAEGGEVDGTLTISAVPASISYRLRFGEGLTLDADKHPTLLAPLRSMTSMHAVVRDAEQRTLAEGPMRFNLRQLPEFLASWLPFDRRQQRALQSELRAAARRRLSGLGGASSR